MGIDHKDFFSAVMFLISKFFLCSLAVFNVLFSNILCVVYGTVKKHVCVTEYILCMCVYVCGMLEHVCSVCGVGGAGCVYICMRCA